MKSRFPTHIQKILTMDAHSADAPGGSIAPTSCATIIDASSGFSPDPLLVSSDRAISCNLVSDVPGGACVGDQIVISAEASLSIESDAGSLRKLAENQTVAESGITEALQETTRHDDIEEDNCVVIADASRQPNSIHDEGGDQDDPNLNADPAGQEDPPETRNHRAGDAQVAPVYDFVLQLLIDLPKPKQNWIHLKLETV